MIGSLRGHVLERIAATTLLLEVSGVGYVCHVTPACCAELEPGVETFLHVHHHIREDAQTLYGFLSRRERDTFEVLVATHGVGPALALSILSTLSPVALGDAVTAGDLSMLTAVPGVGRKTAERLVVELRTRLQSGGDESVGRDGDKGARSVDVREALASLGYGVDEIREAMSMVVSTDRADDMLREALAVLGVRRAG